LCNLNHISGEHNVPNNPPPIVRNGMIFREELSHFILLEVD